MTIRVPPTAIEPHLLPPWDGRFLTQHELEDVRSRACAAYRHNRVAIEAAVATGNHIVIDADDATGATWGAGTTLEAAERAYYVRFRKPLISTYALRVGDI